MNRWRGALLTTLVVGSAGTAAAQRGLDARVDVVRNGRVRFEAPAGVGVCGNGMSWFRTRGGSVNGTIINGNWSGGRDVEARCDRGPVRLVVVRKDGESTEMRIYVGGRWKADTGVTDLGAVSAADAGAWLLRMAESGPPKLARSAITAVTIVDSIDAGAALLRIAKDERRTSDVRSSAMNQLGEILGEQVSQTLDSIAYEAGDREVRKQAIFAMSRRPADEAVPALLKMVESLPDRELRKTAVFWLAQSKDPRAVAWMEKRIGRQ